MTPLSHFLADHAFDGTGKPLISKSASRADLCRLFAAMGFIRGAEIGTWAGEFAEMICQANPGVALTCVDPWQSYAGYSQERKNNQRRLEEAYRLTRSRLKHFHCTLLRMASLDAAKQIPDGSLDFVYIDGNHAAPYISQDLEAWAPKVRSGGIVAGHDYHTRAKKVHLLDVKPAVEAFTQQHGIAPWYVLAGDKAPSYFWVVP
jgi:predicted O-methyltransferase YrrM